ncbi:MAG: hypothetical protein ACOYUZ_05395 [Patescibacteria group bacterium]
MGSLQATIRRQISIHDMSPFHFLQGISGLSAYASRALVCPGIVIAGYNSETSLESLKQSFDALRRLDVGAQELIVLQGENLMEALLRPHASSIMSRFTFFLENGWPISFFLSRDMEMLVDAIGFGWDCILTPRPDIATIYDDKHYVRCLADKLGISHAFPAWKYLSSNLEDLYATRQRILATANPPTDTVFLKVHDFDGGEGILRWDNLTPRAKVEEFANKYLGRGVIMDAGYPRDHFGMQEYSLKVIIHKNGFEPLYVSRQRIRSDAHVGNDVALGEKLLDDVLYQNLTDLVTPICDDAVKRGYGKGRSRTMGIDFMVIPNAGGPVVMLLEINARTTAADYAMAVCLQAKDRFGGQAAVIMENLSGLPAGIDHDTLRDKYLQADPWDGTDKPGFILSNAACLAYGKITAFAIGKDLEQATQVFKKLLPKSEQAKNEPMRVRA